MSVGALIACAAFLLISPLSKRYKENNLLIWGGFFFMVIGRLVFIPYRGELPKLAVDREYRMENGTVGMYDENDPLVLGCPTSSQPWCSTTLQLQFPEFLFGYVISTIGYPIGVTLIQTIFSKILGSRPQGTWMGLFTGAGCVSRIFGPLAVGSLYTRYGTTWTFTITCLMMVLPMIWLYLLRDRLNIEELEIKSVEMKTLNGNAPKVQNGTNGFIKVDRAVIIDESGDQSNEHDKFLSNGK
jgi:MFS transporter, ceroid-lipofuscinosis neuronal protein 7